MDQDRKEQKKMKQLNNFVNFKKKKKKTILMGDISSRTDHTYKFYIYN